MTRPLGVTRTQDIGEGKLKAIGMVHNYRA